MKKLGIISLAGILLSGCSGNIQKGEIAIYDEQSEPIAYSIEPVQITEPEIVSHSESLVGDILKGNTPEISDIPKYKDVDMEPLRQNAIDIFKKVYNTDKNTLISPTSIQGAVALLIDASKDQAHSEIMDFFNQDKNIEQSIENLLSMQYNDSDNVYAMCNTVWVNSNNISNSDILKSYADAVQEKYKATINSSDITKDITPINDWVNENTFGIIKELLNKPVEPDTDAILLNAVGFNCKWEEPFKKENTTQKDFKTAGNKSVKVDMMQGYDNSHYIETDNVYGARIDYAPLDEDYNNKYSLVVLMAKPNKSLDDIIDNMKTTDIVEYITQSNNYTVNLQLPKFNFENTIQLNDVLKKMGIKTAFEDAGQIQILENTTSHISNAIQKDKIEVDEQGTKAAAVTEITMTTDSMVMTPVEVKDVIVDHKFLYMITDNKNKIPVFIGVITDPTKIQ